MNRKPASRILAALMTSAMLVASLPSVSFADDDHRHDRGHHRGHYKHDRAERDRYVREYYERHDRDNDYRRWERNRSRWSDRDYQRWYSSRRHDDDGDSSRAAIIAGIFGLAAGAALGSAVTQSQAQPAYRGAPVAAGSEDWYRYCSAKYRSFNPQTGMYRGYDGQYHACR